MIKERLDKLDYVQRVGSAMDFIGIGFKSLNNGEVYKLAELTGRALTMASLVNFMEETHPDGENHEFIIGFIISAYKEIAEGLEVIKHMVYIRTRQQN